MGLVTSVVIIGGGPGGYESAHVAAQLGAEVTVVDSDGLGGSAVLTDCVPSKTLIATAELMTDLSTAPELGIGTDDEDLDSAPPVQVDLARVNARVLRLAAEQSRDIGRRLDRDGVKVIVGQGRLDGPQKVVVDLRDGGTETLEADAVLVATGAAPRTLPSAEPDGERILTWEQVYDLTEVPSRSGATASPRACHIAIRPCIAATDASMSTPVTSPAA
jgi:dihydrolipoamide dehydrogenase